MAVTGTQGKTTTTRLAESALQAWTFAQYASLLPIALFGRSWWAWVLSHRR